MADIFGKDIRYAHTSETGDLPTLSGLDNYRQALIHRWITEPGSFAARPDYGAGLLAFQNQPMTIANQKQIAKRVESQTLRDPRTEKVISIRVYSDDLKPDRFRLFIKVKPVGYSEYGINFSPFDEEA